MISLEKCMGDSLLVVVELRIVSSEGVFPERHEAAPRVGPDKHQTSAISFIILKSNHLASRYLFVTCESKAPAQSKARKPGGSLRRFIRKRQRRPEGLRRRDGGKEKAGLRQTTQPRRETNHCSIRLFRRLPYDRRGKSFLLFKKPLAEIPRAVGNALTFSMFVISLFFFGAKDMTYALCMFKRLFFWTYPGFLYRTAENFEIAENYVIRQLFSQLGMSSVVTAVNMITFILVLAISAFVMTRKNTSEIIRDTKFDKKTLAGITVLFIWSLISLSNVSTFIYFQF